jgi:hypothetical protein
LNEFYFFKESIWEIDKIIEIYNPSIEWNPELIIENIIDLKERIVSYDIQLIGLKTRIKETQKIKGKNYN